MILILNLGELIYFPIALAVGKVKATFGISLPTCCFLWMSLHFLASYLPKFRLRKVQAHLRKDLSRLESKTKLSGLKASSFSRRYAFPEASLVLLAMWEPGFDLQVGKLPWRRA